MYLSVYHKDFNAYNIIIGEKTKNNVMNGSDFHRIIFSDENTATTGLYIHFTLKHINIEKYFNKIKCHIEHSYENNAVISNIKLIEKAILEKFHLHSNKNIACRINEQLQNGYIKLYGDDTIEYGKHKEVNFFLKISGLWVSNQENELGLTFRFFIYNKLI
jgi:hypothetical protein